MKLVRNTLLAAILFLILFPAAGHAAALLVRWNANTESDIAGYKVYYGTKSRTYGTPVTAGNVTSYQLTGVTPGTTYYIAVTAYDTSGNESGFSTEASAYVPLPDTSAPTGTVAINSGNASTPSRVVNLSLSAVDAQNPVVGMKISNDGTTWSAEGAYATTQSWVLTAGDGDKTVYVMFKDAAGNWSQPVSDTIRLLLDTDGDGLPDAWEISYGLDINNPTDGGLDSDLDGYSNLEEYYNGTNPVASSGSLPVARAGNDQQVTPTRVYLDGSASSDPRGLALKYSWTFMSGPVSVNIENASRAKASFVGTRAGLYRFKLTVSNGKSTAYDTVDVRILNVAPTVSAGDDMTVSVNTPITLHASGADPNGDALTYQWRLVSGPAPMPDVKGQNLTGTPTAAGQYIFSVTCSDGQLTSAADEVVLTVNAANQAPTAAAGEDQSVKPGQQVVLSGIGSTDPDGNPLSYSWKQVSGPVTVTLKNAQTATASFTPAATGTYVFELRVSDGYVSSLPDRVTVTVVKMNKAPVADAGADLNAFVGDMVTLDAGSSYDPDGDALTYAWTQASGATVALSNARTARPSFTPTTSGVFSFTVKVSDGQVTSRDTVQVTVDDLNQVPIADAGPDMTVQTGATVRLNGSRSSDPDGDRISYVWSQVSGPAVSLSYPNSATPSFVPKQTGTYTFGLRVYDGKDTSVQDTVTVVVQSSSVVISLLTPEMGSTQRTNPLFTWKSNKSLAKYRVYASIDKKNYTSLYSGTSTSCRMSSSLWSFFIPSGTTVYWYVEGTTASGTVYKSAISSFKKR